MKKYPQRNASVEPRKCSATELEQLWKTLMEREVQTRKLMQEIAICADDSNAKVMQNEILRRKEFMLELICNEVLSDH